MMFGSRVGFSESANLMVRLSKTKIQYGGWRPCWIYKNGHNFAIGLPTDVIFGNRAPSRSRKPLRLAYDSLRLASWLKPASRGFYGGGVSYGGLRRLTADWRIIYVIHTCCRRHLGLHYHTSQLAQARREEGEGAVFPGLRHVWCPTIAQKYWKGCFSWLLSDLKYA